MLIGMAFHMVCVSQPKPPVVKEGRPPKVTPENAVRIAERFTTGLPLNMALHLETPIIPIDHWHKSLQASPKLSAIFMKAIAERMQVMLLDIAKEKLRTMPATVWILERRFSEYFGNVKASNVTINNTVIGLGQDILTRGQRLLKKQAIQQAIDISSTNVSKTDSHKS